MQKSARSLAAIFHVHEDSKSSAELLSFTASVRPLTLVEGRGKQHQAVHEYLSSGTGFKQCDVARSVFEEFKSANLARHAEVNPALVLSCLREDTRSSLDALTAIELLGYVLSEELPADVVSALQGLKLAPLCGGKVASFSTGTPLYYAFPTGSASGSSGMAQQLVPALTLNLSGVDEDGVARLGASAPGLGIENVRTSEQLATALIAGFLPIRAPPLEYPILQAAIEDRLGGQAPERYYSYWARRMPRLSVLPQVPSDQSPSGESQPSRGLGIWQMGPSIEPAARCFTRPVEDLWSCTDLSEVARVLLPDRFARASSDGRWRPPVCLCRSAQVNASHPAMSVPESLQARGAPWLIMPPGLRESFNSSSSRGSSSVWALMCHARQLVDGACCLGIGFGAAGFFESLVSTVATSPTAPPLWEPQLETTHAWTLQASASLQGSELCTALCDPIAPSDARRDS